MINVSAGKRGSAKDAAIVDFLSGLNDGSGQAMDRDSGAFDSASANSMPDEDEDGIDASASAYDSDAAEWAGRSDTGAAERTGFGELGDTGLAGELGAECPPGPKLVPPTLDQVNPVTADCFAHDDPNQQLLYPLYTFPPTFPPAPFPDTACCPPSNGEQFCALPLVTDVYGLVFREAADDDRYAGTPVADPADIPDTQALLAAAIAFLRQEMDIVRWVLCLVQAYVPRSGEAAVDAVLDGYVDNVTALINGETPPWPGTKAGRSWNGEPWAFTIVGELVKDPGIRAQSVSYDLPNPDGSIGVIVCADHSRIKTWRREYLDREYGRDMVALVSMAGTVLHELVHVWGKVSNAGGDKLGAWHQDADYRYCWDESVMARTAFLWAVSRRYGCLTYPDEDFLTSRDDDLEPGWMEEPGYGNDNPPAPGDQWFPDVFAPPDFVNDRINSWRSDWTFMLDGAVIMLGSI